MIGVFILLLLIGAALLLLSLLGVRKVFLQMAGAALLLGAAGYVLQGRPSLGGSPRAESVEAAPIPLTRLRHAFFGRFSNSEHWQLIAESYARRGNTADAAGVLRSAVRERPGDPALWVGLGNALVDHAHMLTPAAELAYRRAAELAPGHPAPPFFLGLALARSGDREGALTLWREVLASAPAEASWRPLVEDALAALEPTAGLSTRPGQSPPEADRYASTRPPSTGPDRTPRQPPR